MSFFKYSDLPATMTAEQFFAKWGNNEETRKILRRNRLRTFQSKDKLYQESKQERGACCDCTSNDEEGKDIIHFCNNMDSEGIRVWCDTYHVCVECYTDANRVYPRPSFWREVNRNAAPNAPTSLVLHEGETYWNKHGPSRWRYADKSLDYLFAKTEV
jgi:hypothetical protein